MEKEKKMTLRYSWIVHPFSGRMKGKVLEKDILNYIYDMGKLGYEPVMLSNQMSSWLWKNWVDSENPTALKKV